MALSAANGTDIPYEGYMRVEYTLSKNTVAGMCDEPVLVPILVASSDFERPIIGFNVIEQLALTNDASGGCIPSADMVQRLCSALDVGRKSDKALLSVSKTTAQKPSPHSQTKQTTSYYPKKQSDGGKMWPAK